MDTSDDIGGLFGGGGGGVDIPTRRAENVSRTAKPLDQVSEAGKKKRRLDASVLTKGFGIPKLGKTGLLGLSDQSIL